MRRGRVRNDQKELIENYRVFQEPEEAKVAKLHDTVAEPEEEGILRLSNLRKHRLEFF